VRVTHRAPTVARDILSASAQTLRRQRDRALRLTAVPAQTRSAHGDDRAARRPDHYCSWPQALHHNGPVAECSHLTPNDKTQGPTGISSFIVERICPGFKESRIARQDGFRRTNAELLFDIVPRVAWPQRVGDENAGVSTWDESGSIWSEPSSR